MILLRRKELGWGVVRARERFIIVALCINVASGARDGNVAERDALEVAELTVLSAQHSVQLSLLKFYKAVQLGSQECDLQYGGAVGVRESGPRPAHGREAGSVRSQSGNGRTASR